MSVASLSEKVYCHTPHRVFAGDLASGDRLLNRSLAREPGTRFIPVREAISRLASEGPVEQVAGAGASGPTLDRRGVSEIGDVRDWVEPCAAAEAARLLTDHSDTLWRKGGGVVSSRMAQERPES